MYNFRSETTLIKVRAQVDKTGLTVSTGGYNVQITSTCRNCKYP